MNAKPSTIANISFQYESTSEGSGVNHGRKGSIFVAIDTSGSMNHYNKIQQVCSSLEEIISKTPDDIYFIARVFSGDVSTILRLKKKDIDVQRLKKDIIAKASVGAGTALYDAWGQTIEQIPYADYKDGGIVHVLIFTDGEDNVSQRYNLETVINLTNKHMRKNMHFTFIQAGLSINDVRRAITTRCPQEHCSVLNVQDSADGIRMAFAQAGERIRIQLGIQIQTSENYLDVSRAVLATMGLGLSGSNALPSFMLGSSHGSMNLESTPQKSIQHSAPTTSFLPKSQKKSAKKAQPTVSEVWVGNIPLTASQQDICKVFGHFGLGKCKVLSRGQKDQHQWATIQYDEPTGASNAIKYGTGYDWHGSKLVVRQRT